MLKQLVMTMALLMVGGRVLTQQQQQQLEGENVTKDETKNCPVNDDSYLKDKVEELDKKVEGILNETQGVKGIIESLKDQISHPVLGSFLNPAPSCQLIPQGSPSGHYWIQNAGTGYANLEYCDMTRTCCNSTGGWMRVANLDMNDRNQQCPSGFGLITSPRRACGISGSGCRSAIFPLDGVKYSRVCGKIIGYQYATPDAFNPYYYDRSRTIDSQYVEGVSLTHGQRPRKHIWTFAAAVDESTSQSGRYVCPCTRTNTRFAGVVPPFIGQDYFCDSGSRYYRQYRWYHADPLWNGSGCGPTSSCCGFNNPPWFCKQLPQPTTDDIEMRLCFDQSTSDENIIIKSVEIYVQ